jgi:hypothetical protein
MGDFEDNCYVFLQDSPGDWVDPDGTEVRIPGKLNCLGYATGEGCAVAPEAGKESLQDTLKKLGWTCGAKGTKSKDCECKCPEHMLMIYIYKYGNNKVEGKVQDPWTDPWIRDPKKNDYHAIRCNDPPDPKKPNETHKCTTGWSYIPFIGTPMKPGKQGNEPIEPGGNLKDLNGVEHKSGSFGALGKLDDADAYWKKGVPERAYCCCKPGK